MPDNSTLPSGSGRMVVPSDTQSYAPGRAIYVGVIGDVTLVDESGNTLLFKNAIGTIPVRATKIKATGTTATNIIILY